MNSAAQALPPTPAAQAGHDDIRALFPIGSTSTPSSMFISKQANQKQAAIDAPNARIHTLLSSKYAGQSTAMLAATPAKLPSAPSSACSPRSSPPPPPYARQHHHVKLIGKKQHHQHINGHLAHHRLHHHHCHGRLERAWAIWYGEAATTRHWDACLRRFCVWYGILNMEWIANP